MIATVLDSNGAWFILGACAMLALLLVIGRLR